MYKTKMVCLLVSTLVSITGATVLFPSLDYLILLLRPIIICLIGLFIFKEEFTRKSVGVALFASWVICTLSLVGWESVFYLPLVLDDDETLWGLCIYYIFSACALFITRGIIASILKTRKNGKE